MNVYVDSVEDVRQVQQPQPQWPDDVVSSASLSIENVQSSFIPDALRCVAVPYVPSPLALPYVVLCRINVR